MIVAMLLAHLISDYIVQWDALAQWKSRALTGALVHGAIVSTVTVGMAVMIDPVWWPWAVFIGLTHTAIDVNWVWINRRFAARSGLYALVRLMIDQTAHLAIIAIALIASGALRTSTLIVDILSALHTYRPLAIVLGYAFVTLPAWILIEFTFYGLVNGSAPDFTHARRNKYVGSLERGLITTFVLLGQFVLVPIVALPRLIFDSPHIIGRQRSTLYVAEWLGSMAVAVLIGLGLKTLTGH
jgi:hypothetical protein